MNYYEKHIGDWIKDTVSLDMTEDGAYNRLVDQCYQSEKPLPPDIKEVYRLARANKPVERKAVDYVLGRFFDLGPNGYTQKRVQAEIARYVDKQTKARASADARWNKAKTHTDGNANASPEHPTDAHADSMRSHSEGNALHTPDTSYQTPEDKGAGIREAPARTPAAEAVIAMKAAGMQAVNPSHPKLISLLEAGITVDELAQAAADAIAKGKTFSYALATAEGRRRDAAVAPLPDRASITVPSRQGPDPTLARLAAERAAWTPPAAEVKAMLAQTAARLKGAAP